MFTLLLIVSSLTIFQTRFGIILCRLQITKQGLCIFQLWYALSKTLAEDAATKFSKDNALELVTINPGYVIGPILQPTLNLTSEDIMSFIKTGNCLPQLTFISMSDPRLDPCSKPCIHVHTHHFFTMFYYVDKRLCTF